MDSAASPSQKRVTRQDVARYAQVSTAVVSYALNGGPKPIAAATRERVLEAVRVLGYRPNAAARTLRRGLSDMIGLIVPDIRNPYYAELCHAVEVAAAKHGLVLLIINTLDESRDLSRNIMGLSSRQVDGVIIASELSPDDAVLVRSQGIPAVLMNQFVNVSQLPSFGVDYRLGAKDAVNHLIGHGHRSIAFLGGDSPTDGRELGWADALAEAGLPRGPEIHEPWTREGGFVAGQRLASVASAVTAAFVSSDQQAVSVLAALRTAGVRVPEDMAIVSFDGSLEGEYCAPPLTSMRQPIDEIAVDAVERLLAGTSDESYVLRPTRLVIRRSCGCENANVSSA